MLRNNRKLISHFNHRISVGKNNFIVRSLENPICNNLLAVYQHSHVIKKENSVLSDLLDVLHLREAQLTCDTPLKEYANKLISNTNLPSYSSKIFDKNNESKSTNEPKIADSKLVDILNKNSKSTLPQSNKQKKIIDENTNMRIRFKKEFGDLKKEINKNKKMKEESDIDRQQKNFNDDVKTYVDICSRSKSMLPNAMRLVEYYTRDTKEEFTNSHTGNKSYRKITDIEIFNKLMFAFAKDGKIKKIIWCFDRLSSINVKPNLDSYLAALISIAHSNNNDNSTQNNSKSDFNKSLVMRILLDCEKSNLNISEAATSLNYSSEQMMAIEKALNLVNYKFRFVDTEDLSKKNSLTSHSSSRNNSNNKQAQSISYENKYYCSELSEKNTILKNFQDQIKIEKKFMIEVPSIYERSGDSLKSEQFKSFLKRRFREKITRNFVKLLNSLENSALNNDVRKFPADDKFLYPFLSIKDKKVYIDMLDKEVEILSQVSDYYSNSLRQISINIGSRIEDMFRKNCAQSDNDIEKIRKNYSRYIDHIFDSSDSDDSQRENWLKIMREEKLFNFQGIEPWSYEIKKRIGNILLEKVLLKSCTLPAKSKYGKEDNAFYKIYRTSGVYKDPQIKVHPLISKIFSTTLIFEANKLPMVTPPLPFYSMNKGGYLISDTKFFQTHPVPVEQLNMNSKFQSYMYPIYDSLNVLSSCPWKINTTLLDMIIKIFNEKGNKKLDVPQPSEEGPEIPEPPINTSDKKAYAIYMKKKIDAEKVRAEMHSLWCSELYRLSIANMYRDKVIWFPHNMDFRGRTYPIPPYFNHLGCDISRSLILFANGKELGKDGLDQLKLHCINLTSTMNKATLKERLDYADSIIDDIIDSAKNPFTGKLWWQQWEDKWQVLACCIELKNALETNNPEKYISHFPIHHDGSCNGLQHYAALGRDKKGAMSVNLAPAERPNDVYSTVLDIVEEARKKDEKTSETARILKGRIQRKVVKQTIMTTVYNVTFYGARRQIKGQLQDIEELKRNDVILKDSSLYLATKTFESIRKIFTAAKEIQDWFAQCSHLITYIREKNISWQTPLGLFIVQTYEKKLPSGTCVVPNIQKQRNAFAPNFIHSLDSCHMMLTSLHCQKAGIQFVSVHDCFWTHPSTAIEMNKICRDQFVALHSQPLLDNLSQYFMDNFGFTEHEIMMQEKHDIKQLMLKFNDVLMNVPQKGNFNLDDVKDSVYFFS